MLCVGHLRGIALYMNSIMFTQNSEEVMCQVVRDAQLWCRMSGFKSDGD